MNKIWYAYLLWTLGAAVLGFGIAAVFAGLLKLPRPVYLVPYIVLVSLYFYTFMRWSGLSIVNLLRHNWYWGVIGAVLVGAFTIHNITSQPASARADGLLLVFELLWIGAVYGLVDALLLSVLPVLATWQGFSTLGWTSSLPGKIVTGAIVIMVSLLVTVVYHFGYPECRSIESLAGPTIGNGAMTLGFVLANNPIAAIFSHIAMHIAGVLHGPATVIQLPPHY